MLKRNPNFQCTILVPACICAVIGLILCFVSICTPSWQVVYLRELQQWVENGLWINCQTRPAGMYTCVYTFSESDYNFYTSSEVVNFRTPGKELWQRKLLIAILCAQLSGFLGLFSYCITFYQPASRCSSMFFTSSIGLACVINTVVCIIFSFYSHMVEYRFFHVSVSGIYEKHMGYSFVLQV
uniref:Clc-like protein n=1 Tax=Rhabditophanes sp. KR3021 TaxID=114890 RepID=A0AC35UIB2_9BILA